MRRMCFLTTAALTSLVGVLIAGAPASVPSASEVRNPTDSVRKPSQAVLCGPNALYMFLKAHDRPISADVFFGEVEPGDQGMSLTDLREASKRYGLSAEVRQCTYEQLADGCPLPLIALLQPGREPTSRDEGHYVLVVDADSDQVTVIDGTNGEQKRYRRDAFLGSWEGYVLVPTGGQPNWLLLLAISLAVWGLVGWLILRSNRLGARTRHSTAREAPTDARAK